MNHRAILAQGIEHWNQWRSHHPNTACTLEGADLRHGQFIGCNFRHVNLKGANLHQADLKNADLTGANLTGADLTGTHLERTIFYAANLSSANLAKAILDRTDLRAANLTDTLLVETDIRSVQLTGLSDPHPSGPYPVDSYPHHPHPAINSSPSIDSYPPQIPTALLACASPQPALALSTTGKPATGKPATHRQTTHMQRVRTFRPSRGIPAFVPVANALHQTEQRGTSRFASRLRAFIRSKSETEPFSATASCQRTKQTENASHRHQIQLAKGKFYIL